MKTLARVLALLVLSLGSCKSDDPARDVMRPDRAPSVDRAPDLPPGTTVTRLGPQGGKALSIDGNLELDVPAGALSAEVAITISIAQRVPTGNILVGYDIGPTGLPFDKAAFMRIRYDAAQLEIAESRLRLGTVIGETWQTVDGSTVDVTRHQVNGQTMHLSLWGIVPVAETIDAGPDLATPDLQAPPDLFHPDLPQPWTTAVNEVWYPAGTLCYAPKMALVPKPGGAIEVQLTGIAKGQVQDTCGGHTALVTLTGMTLNLSLIANSGSACNTACWDFTFQVQGLPPGTYTVKILTFTDTVTLSGASG